MSEIIPYGRQHITQEDIDAVTSALKSDYLTQGPRIASFEVAFAAYVGSDYAVAVSNGTAGLHLAVMALGLEKDEYVICTPITFAASANCVEYCGGNVLFADIDPQTYLMDLNSAKRLIEANPDKKIKGIIPVDFAGRVVQLDAFKSLADAHDLWIIEDACHAPGGYFIDDNNQQQKAGNGEFANASVFSFHPVKHIATGEGGMITTNDKAVYERLMTLRTHGISRDVSLFENSLEIANGGHESTEFPGWYMEMHDLGYNFRITDIQAALGTTQLAKADIGLARRREIAKLYTEAFSGHTGIVNCSGITEGHAYHLFVLEVEDRRGLYDFLRANKIFTQIHYIPVHLMPYYSKKGWKLGDFPKAEKYYSRCISIPMYPTITDEQINRVITKIREFYARS